MLAALVCRAGRLAPILLLALTSACADSDSPGTLVARDAWIPAPPPGAPAAAYLTIENGTNREARIVGAACDAAERVEIHRTLEVEGVMRMEPLAAIDVPAGRSAVLAPRGIHLMLIGPGDLEAGVRVPLTLLTAGGERIEVEAMVRPPGDSGRADAPMDHDAHSGHH